MDRFIVKKNFPHTGHNTKFKIQYGQIYRLGGLWKNKFAQTFKIQYGQIYRGQPTDGAYKHGYLKSNMDRFIACGSCAPPPCLSDLKSNMDRFIGSTGIF